MVYSKNRWMNISAAVVNSFGGYCTFIKGGIFAGLLYQVNMGVYTRMQDYVHIISYILVWLTGILSIQCMLHIIPHTTFQPWHWFTLPLVKSPVMWQHCRSTGLLRLDQSTRCSSGINQEMKEKEEAIHQIMSFISISLFTVSAHTHLFCI